ncbi:hypothetical protein F4778DRAFT_787371 [Xylariomycetidae sp. FL2044]|nr:hypothetical protein F4778DRAFT_787371 [Xylariomycetidae sp. FL2044]
MRPTELKTDAGAIPHRCRRMNIACTPQTTKSLRRPRQIRVEPEPVGETAAGHRGVPPVTGSRANSGATRPSAVFTPSQPDRVTAEPDHRGLTHRGAAAELPSNSSSNSGLPRAQEAVMPGFGINWGQAEKAVARFKVDFTPHFPFVVLDPDITARQTLLENPLVFRVILLIAADITLRKRREIKRSVSAYIGHHLLVNEERDIRLLQGLIAFIAWGNHEFYMDRQITHLTYLAVGYAHNLRITHQPLTMRKIKAAANPGETREAMIGWGMNTVIEDQPSLAEQRAYLGCYYLLSINSIHFGRKNQLEGDYIDRCIASLRSSPEIGVDFVLDKMISFRRVIETISQTLPTFHDIDRNDVFTPAVEQAMQTLRAQLDELLADVAYKHPRLGLLWNIHNCALVRLYAPATCMSPEQQPGGSSNSRSRNRNSNISPPQLQCFKYCLEAARSFFGTLLSADPERSLVYTTSATFSDITFVTVAASRLLLMTGLDGWDVAWARRTLDLPAVMGRMIAAFTSARESRDQRARAARTAAASVGVGIGIEGLDRRRSRPDNDDEEEDEGEEDYDQMVKIVKKLKLIKAWSEEQFSTPVAADPSQDGDDEGDDDDDDNDNDGDDDDDGEPGTSDWLPDSQVWSQFMLGVLGNESWDIAF